VSSFHQSPRWRALRLEAKRRDGWKCAGCGSRVGLEVDHIEPVDRRPDLALVLGNLRTLCRDCHIAKTKAERGRSLTEDRAAWDRAIFTLCRTKVP
jgi:5-methylcytosine-specific restriction endonuclease McrA